MIRLDVYTHGDNCWPDLIDTNGQPKFVEGTLVGIARLPDATAKGNSTVTVRVELPDGTTVLAQTTLALIHNAVNVFKIAEEKWQ